MSESHEVVLQGCTPEPLMSYLKALGILRLVAEQADPGARGCWRDGVFVLRSKLDRESIERFFLTKYQPSPIVAPWAGGSGFFGRDNKTAISELSGTTCPRFATYRDVIAAVHQILEQDGIEDKPSPEQKVVLLRRYRREMPDAFIRWMDTAIVLQDEGQAFPPILGTGANDGRLDFTQNFMQRLIVLGLHLEHPADHSIRWLRHALTGQPTDELPSAAVGQFAPGRAGGPNATQGLEGSSVDNPWDFVLMIEGSLFLAGTVARRLGTLRDKAAYPFTVRVTPAGFASGATSDSDNSRGEMWLPLWRYPATLDELRLLFGEGRADLAGRQSRDGLDFARAVAGLGVDRGITSFVRIGFLRRSGKAYLATPLGHFNVNAREAVDLLMEIEDWLDRLRRACDDKAPARFTAALRRIEQTMFDFCRYGAESRFADILCALGNAERSLAVAPRFREDKRLAPLIGLSADWVRAANDGSVEFELALAIAGIYDRSIGHIRKNLEPVVTGRRKDGVVYAGWETADNAVVWNSADLADNLAAVLARRLMDGQRADCDGLPLAFERPVSLDAVAAFIGGEDHAIALNEDRISDLIWGLMAVEVGKADRPQFPDRDPPLLPRAYALLKPLFTPRMIDAPDGIDGLCPEPEILPLLRANRVGDACRLAMRRLRIAGLKPLPHRATGHRARDVEWHDAHGTVSDGPRLAAALLLPISPLSLNDLLTLVTRPSLEPNKRFQ
jgi:CRISPR-associated protein Csx17